MRRYDFIVLGSGIAGLSFALKVAPHGRVAIITKKNRAESNTNYAQGGIAAVTSKEDSFELHVRDTLEAGAGLCKEEVVRTIVQEFLKRYSALLLINRDGRSSWQVTRTGTNVSGTPAEESSSSISTV